MQSSMWYNEDRIGFKLALRLKKVYELAVPQKQAYLCEEDIEDEYDAQTQQAYEAREKDRKERDVERQMAEKARKERKKLRDRELAERAAKGEWKQQQLSSSRRSSLSSTSQRRRRSSAALGDGSDEGSEDDSVAVSHSHVFTFTGTMNATNGMPIRLSAEEKAEAEAEYEADQSRAAAATIPIAPPPPQYPSTYGPPAAIVIRDNVVLPRPPSTFQGVYNQQHKAEDQTEEEASHENQVSDATLADPPVMFRSIAVTCVALITSALVSIMAFASLLNQRWLVAEGTNPSAYSIFSQGIVLHCNGASCSRKNYDQLSSCGASSSAIKLRYDGVLSLMCVGLILSVTMTILFGVTAFRLSHFRVIFARLAADPQFFDNRREALVHRIRVKKKKVKVAGEVEGTRRAAVVAGEREKLDKKREVVIDLQNLRGSIRSTMHVLFVSVLVGFLGWVMLITAPALYQHTEEQFIHCGTSSCDILEQGGNYTCSFGSGFALAVCAALFVSFTLVLVVIVFIFGISDVYTSLVTVGGLLEFEEGALQKMYVDANVRVACAENEEEEAAAAAAQQSVFTPHESSSPTGVASNESNNPLVRGGGAQSGGDVDIPRHRNEGSWKAMPLYARSIDPCPQPTTHPNLAQSGSEFNMEKKGSSTGGTWAPVEGSPINATLREANADDADFDVPSWQYCERQRLFYDVSYNEYYDPSLRRWYVPSSSTWFQAA